MDTRAAELRTLRFVSGGMLAGVLFMLTVILLVRPAERSGPELLAYVACGLALLSLPIASVFRSARWPTTTPEQDKEYWVKRKVAHMVSLGLLEGPALFCCVATDGQRALVAAARDARANGRDGGMVPARRIAAGGGG
jgi:hypothetical protein